jgi:hypothetical protein
MQSVSEILLHSKFHDMKHFYIHHLISSQEPEHEIGGEVKEVII